MRRVIIESPYAGNIKRNTEYARACMHDCINRGEAPFASHLLYTQPGVLIDEVPEERAIGIAAGLAWGDVADAVVAYCDLGITDGMNVGLKVHTEAGRLIEMRFLGGDWHGRTNDRAS